MLEYILGTLTDADVEWLSDHGECRELVAGEAVTRQGDPDPDLLLVLEGRLRQSDDGLRFGPGELVGLVSLLDGGPSPAGFEAEDRAMVMVFEAAAVRDRLGLDIGFAARFYRALAVIEAARWRIREEGAEGGRDGDRSEMTSDGVSVGLVEDRLRRLVRRLADPPTHVVNA